jgi:hypothetical protein
MPGAPHPNMRPPMMRLPVPSDQQQQQLPPPMMGQPPRQMPPVGNFQPPPPNNPVRMGPPPFRPNMAPPPQNIGPRPPPPVEYYNGQPQFHGGAPTASYPQRQPPPPFQGQPMQPVPVDNRVGGGDVYHNTQTRPDVSSVVVLGFKKRAKESPVSTFGDFPFRSTIRSIRNRITHNNRRVRILITLIQIVSFILS